MPLQAIIYHYITLHTYNTQLDPPSLCVAISFSFLAWKLFPLFFFFFSLFSFPLGINFYFFFFYSFLFFVFFLLFVSFFFFFFKTLLSLLFPRVKIKTKKNVEPLLFSLSPSPLMLAPYLPTRKPKFQTTAQPLLFLLHHLLSFLFFSPLSMIWNLEQKPNTFRLIFSACTIPRRSPRVASLVLVAGLSPTFPGLQLAVTVIRPTVFTRSTTTTQLCIAGTAFSRVELWE